MYPLETNIPKPYTWRIERNLSAAVGTEFRVTGVPNFNLFDRLVRTNSYAQDAIEIAFLYSPDSGETPVGRILSAYHKYFHSQAYLTPHIYSFFFMNNNGLITIANQITAYQGPTIRQLLANEFECMPNFKHSFADLVHSDAGSINDICAEFEIPLL